MQRGIEFKMLSRRLQEQTERMPFPASMRRSRRHRLHRRAGRRSGRKSFDAWSYTYDAENRLIGALNGNTRLEFIYDALGRRVAKKLYQYDSLSKHERYVYDGMKLVRSYDAIGTIPFLNTILWQPFGLDVPLIMTYNSTVYGYLVDANKNVLGLFNPSKTRVATYLYGPFGQKLSESGTIAANNPLQFSSEQFDADLGLVYYNFRYYFPAIGKWLTTDPIGEEGGWNLYAFCGNNAVNTWDRWGFAKELSLIIIGGEGPAFWGANLPGGMPSIKITGFPDMIKKMKDFLKNYKDECPCYKYLKIYTHGTEGKIHFTEDDFLRIKEVNSDYEIEYQNTPYLQMSSKEQDRHRAEYDGKRLLKELKSMLCEISSIEFYECNSGAGDGVILGQKVSDELSEPDKHFTTIIIYPEKKKTLSSIFLGSIGSHSFYPTVYSQRHYNNLPSSSKKAIEKRNLLK